MRVYTDLAAEAHALWKYTVAKTSALPGVIAREHSEAGFTIETIAITDSRGAETLKKPIGNYVSITLDGKTTNAADVIAAAIGRLAPLETCTRVLIAGLGNPEVTCDSLGALALDGVIVTRHLIAADADKDFQTLRSVAALRTGVLGMSGIETAEIITAVLDSVDPDLLIVIDALASAEAGRICESVQLTDTGLVPGSGTDSARAKLTPEKLGLPVLAIGIPTMRLTINDEQLGDERFIVTRRDIDSRIRELAKVLAGGLNLALHGVMSL
ncbi:MAG: GPR endopeptidase [Oscillospiraceae bacterium]|jgi:spore protease|nr:GPR endopeptidase [Oscillospiraceae bacterium]